ncbi:GNAT family N-acetyltransferase [Bacillus sp. 1P06AnD]|uniref:GNAT family N-acetyltransferase n=1 Tax=Bacillus sp. 1P06AnD TaxID=3132208 RepID=UPI0039A3BCFE
MFIETRRLQIRLFEPSDWPSLYTYTSNGHVMKYIPEGTLSEDEAKTFVNDHLGDDAKYFPVVLKAGGAMIGHIVFHPYFGDHTYEIGWVFNPDYHNKGYATEAARAILDFGFNKMKLHRIVATCQPQNEPSFRVMEKIGMRREGFFKKCIPHESEWWDEYYYAILSEEFQ